MHLPLQHLSSECEMHPGTPQLHTTGRIRPLLTLEEMHMVGLLVVGRDDGVGVALQKDDPTFVILQYPLQHCLVVSAPQHPDPPQGHPLPTGIRP